MKQVSRWWNGRLIGRRDLWLYADGTTWRVEGQGDGKSWTEGYPDEAGARARIAEVTADDRGWRELV